MYINITLHRRIRRSSSSPRAARGSLRELEGFKSERIRFSYGAEFFTRLWVWAHDNCLGIGAGFICRYRCQQFINLL